MENNETTPPIQPQPQGMPPTGPDLNKILTLGVGYLRLFELCTQSYEIYQDLLQNPIPYLTKQGRFIPQQPHSAPQPPGGPNGTYVPGVGMQIPEDVEVYFAPAASYPWIVAYNGQVDTGGFSKTQTTGNENAFYDLLNTLSCTNSSTKTGNFSLDIIALLLDLHKEVPGKPFPLPFDIGNILVAVFEGPGFYISITGGTPDVTPPMGTFYSMAEFSGRPLPIFFNPSDSVKMVVLLPDWTAYNDALLTVTLATNENPDASQIVLSTC